MRYTLSQLNFLRQEEIRLKNQTILSQSDIEYLREVQNGIGSLRRKSNFQFRLDEILSTSKYRCCLEKIYDEDYYVIYIENKVGKQNIHEKYADVYIFTQLSKSPNIMYGYINDKTDYDQLKLSVPRKLFDEDIDINIILQKYFQSNIYRD